MTTVLIATLFTGDLVAQDRVVYPEPPESPEAYIKMFTAHLDEIEALIADDTVGKAPLFSGHLYLAHGKYAPIVSVERLIDYADALHELGIQRIELFTTQSAWPDRDPETIAKYDAVIAHIRSLGLEIGFDPTVDPASLAGGKYTEWKPWAIAAYAEQARRYQPEKFSVLHEPAAMNARLNEGITPEEWARFTEEACAAIHSVSPRTQCTVAVIPVRERASFDALLGVAAVESIGFDIYRMGPALTEVEDMIKAARAAGKRVHIAETWRAHWAGFQTIGGTHQMGADFDIGLERYAKLDHRWLEVMTRYAWAREMETIMPFWTATFFGYVKPGENGSAIGPDFRRAVLEGLEAGHRTESFHVYKRLIDQYKGR